MRDNHPSAASAAGRVGELPIAEYCTGLPREHLARHPEIKVGLLLPELKRCLFQHPLLQLLCRIQCRISAEERTGGRIGTGVKCGCVGVP